MSAIFISSNEIKFLVEIKAGTVLNIWISCVGNIIEIKEELEKVGINEITYIYYDL